VDEKRNKIYSEDIQFSYEVLAHWRRRVRGYNVLAESRRGSGAGEGEARCDGLGRV